MPAWKGRLTEAEIGAVVAYVLTLSKLTSDSAEATLAAPVASLPAAASEAPPKESESLPVDSGIFGNAEQGKALFFDLSNDWHCSACHRIGGPGSSVGPDLSGVKAKAVKDLFIDIVLPSARLSPDRPLLNITTKSGEQIQGVKSEESATHIKLYDIGSLPPVLRNLPKDQIRNWTSKSDQPCRQSMERCTPSTIARHHRVLKEGGPGPAQVVSLNDLR
jgi:putative heme-binding domain-containing protein